MRTTVEQKWFDHSSKIQQLKRPNLNLMQDPRIFKTKTQFQAKLLDFQSLDLDQFSNYILFLGFVKICVNRIISTSKNQARKLISMYIVHENMVDGIGSSMIEFHL